jgi:enamine deaminase RidA (YjgF/YER057c/UK114 family)
MIKTLASQDRGIPRAAGSDEFAPASVGMRHSVVRLGSVVRVAFTLTPNSANSLDDQLAEVLASMRESLRPFEWPMSLTTQTIFLRSANDQPLCERFFAGSGLHRRTLTHYVVQPPCGGARIAVEAWAVGGPNVNLAQAAPNSLAVEYDGIRWIHTAESAAADAGAGVCSTASGLFRKAGETLAAAGAAWRNVVRTWWYVGDITGAEGGTQRYKELNRARTQAFAGMHFGKDHMRLPPDATGYPASTGIGMTSGAGLSLATLALQTARSDVRLVPLENPLQTPAYDYAACYSPQSPKFSRAMALVTPEYVTTWISGTASIVQSEVIYPESVTGQTEQTLDNIAALVTRENFTAHGVRGAAATLRDLAKVRVYVKRARDFAACRAVCDRRLGGVPAVYVQADICRPELLVEIEGVTFSRRIAETAQQ